MMLLFSPCKRCPCPCFDVVLRSCEEALAGIILHRPPSLWFAWVRSGCAGGIGPGGGGGRDARARILDWYLLSPKSETPISFCQPAKAQDQPIKLDFAGVSSQRGNALDAP